MNAPTMHALTRIASAATLAVLVGCGGATGRPYYPFGAEATIRTAQSISDHASVVALVADAKANQIDTLVVAAKQDEDDEYPSGTVFYASAIAPQANPDFDALQDVITEAHKVGIKVKAWVPQFHDQVAFNLDPSWRMQALNADGSISDYTGATPGTAFFVNSASPAVQAYELSIIEEIVTNYAVDGLVLDWIRFDGYNMDMGPATIAAYLAATPGAKDPTTIDLSTDNPDRRSWQAWRTTQIGNYVGTVRSHVNAIKSKLPLGAFILPPEFAEVGQDAAKFKGSIDFVCPMCYWEDWGFLPGWVAAGVLKDTAAKVGPNVMIIPTVGVNYGLPGIQQANIDVRAQYPGITTMNYFNYWAWDTAAFQRANTYRKN
jgi:uncharacterized lipoprotein YddW (UPF0748 family)